MLKAPQSPRSEVTSTMARRRTSRRRNTGWSESLDAVARFRRTFRSSIPYGRAASTATWARRSLAAETISIVLVIWAVLPMERIRRRMSRSVAIGLGLRSLRELRFVLLDGLLQLHLDRVGQLVLGAKVVHHVGEFLFEEVVEAVLEPAQDVHGKVVQVPVGAGVDDRDLSVHGQRAV